MHKIKLPKIGVQKSTIALVSTWAIGDLTFLTSGYLSILYVPVPVNGVDHRQEIQDYSFRYINYIHSSNPCLFSYHYIEYTRPYLKEVLLVSFSPEEASTTKDKKYNK